jgi:MFS transporter, MHS family, proline/betaine transporter
MLAGSGWATGEHRGGMSMYAAPGTAHRRLILAGIAGNVLEWYDFAVYGYFAPVLGRLFFPASDPTASLLAAFGVFGVGFLMRPLGSIVFGHVGDRLGRTTALRWSVAAMALPTCAIGLLPTYGAVGALAPVLLLLCRLVQGLAMGGEFTGSSVFLVETASPARRGLAGSWTGVGVVAGSLLGSAVGAAVTGALPADGVANWGWRVPFLLGLAVGAAGILLRRGLAAEAPARPERSPLAAALRTRPLAMLRVVALSLPNLINFYLIFVYAVTWLKLDAHVPFATALDINTANMVVLLLILPLSAWLSDRVGRRPVMAAGAAGLAALSWPLMALMHSGQTATVFLGQFGFALLVGIYAGPSAAAMSELFPRGLRCTGVGVAYSLTASVLGGTTPLVATYLISRTHDDLTPALYAMIAPAVTLIAVLTLPESAFRPLDPPLPVEFPGPSG